MTPAGLHRRDVEAAAALLRRACKRIGSDHWSRDRLARTRRGTYCASVDERAVRWSLLGAIHVELEKRLYGRHKEDRVYGLALGALEAVRPSWRAWHEEEGRKARDVIALASRAAKHLEKELQP